MNFFEVKIGKTSRRGSFESFNSFVAKTEMNSHELWNSLRERYKGFEVSVNNVETIVEFEKPVVVDEEDMFFPTVENKTVHSLDMCFKTADLQDDELAKLRKDYEDKLVELNKITSTLKSRINVVLQNKYNNVCRDIINIEKNDTWFSGFKCVLLLKGDLKQMLEEDGK